MKHCRYPHSVLVEAKGLVALAIPLVATQLAQVAMVFTDTVMMGMLGAHSLAGGGLGATVFSFLYIICIGVITAVGNLVAHAHGKGDRSGVSNAVRAGFIVSVGLAVICAAILWNAAALLRLFGQQEGIVTTAAAYLHAVLWGVAPGLWFMSLRGFTIGMTRPGPVTAITVGAVGFNVIANYVLMYGAFGFPALGVAGIGWASSLVFFCMFIAMALSTQRDAIFAHYRVFSAVLRTNRRAIAELLRLGLPVGVTYGVESGMFLAAAFMMGLLGTAELAAHHIASQSVYVAFMIPVGICYAVSMLIGQAHGAGDLYRARQIARLGLAIGVACMTVTALVFWKLPDVVVGLFIGSDSVESAAVTRFAIEFLAVAAVFQIFDGSQSIASGAIRGLKDSKSTMIIGSVGYWIVGVPAAIFFGFVAHQGGVGVWWGLACGLACAAVLLVARFELKIHSMLLVSPELARPNSDTTDMSVVLSS